MASVLSHDVAEHLRRPCVDTILQEAYDRTSEADDDTMRGAVHWAQEVRDRASMCKTRSCLVSVRPLYLLATDACSCKRMRMVRPQRLRRLANVHTTCHSRVCVGGEKNRPLIDICTSSDFVFQDLRRRSRRVHESFHCGRCLNDTSTHMHFNFRTVILYLDLETLLTMHYCRMSVWPSLAMVLHWHMCARVRRRRCREMMLNLCNFSKLNVHVNVIY